MTTSHTLVSAADLETMRTRGDVLIVDARFDLADPGKGERDYAAAHVPGAVYAHLDRDLSDLGKRGLGRHPLPDDAAFSAALSRWGWRRDLDVVVYDDANGALAAARLWWLLRLAGHERVAVLDGGFAAWKAGGYPLESGIVVRTATDTRVVLDRDEVVWFDELEARRAAHGVLLLDARAAPRFRGEVEPIDPVAGHVPDAVNRAFSENLDTSGRFKPAAELRREFETLLGGRTAREVVHMCGSGVTACHNLLAMEQAGLAGSRVFAPSWSGWIADPERAVAQG
ncbi:sulfurtransferase [Dokdonella sp.]|uniref:sulfurtransferase n=1 Tax=Dokdonella sp. TaxID=2291710 RepID=UPI001B07DF4C|nr:sulfurtransferase [Dokdonella sp.]MBO9662393.1 sulfurtransferase [Dokdonella sp.]